MSKYFLFSIINVFMFRLLYANWPNWFTICKRASTRLFAHQKEGEGQGYYVEAPQKDALTKIRTALGDNARSKIHNRNNAREFGAKFYRDEDKDEEEIY